MWLLLRRWTQASWGGGEAATGARLRILEIKQVAPVNDTSYAEELKQSSVVMIILVLCRLARRCLPVYLLAAVGLHTNVQSVKESVALGVCFLYQSICI